MTKLDFEVEIPFVENTGRRCVPACTGMTLNTLMPEHGYETSQIEQMCGFRPDRSTWAAQHLLALDDLGIDVGWIEDDDLPLFASDPYGLKRRQMNSTEFKVFTESNDLELEALRVATYLERGLPFEQRRSNEEDIVSKLESGWLVRLEVNGKILADQEGYANHAVMVSGFNDKVVRLENPDGLYGSKPKQLVTWGELSTAREGGHGAMHYYKLSN